MRFDAMPARAASAIALGLALSLAVMPLAPAPARPRQAAARPVHIPAPAPTPAAAKGLAYAQGHCAACHGVKANSTSPNPESPPFDDIANREGLSAESFARFLSDAHNYPAAMDFRIEPGAVPDLAAYMESLRRPGYKPTR